MELMQISRRLFLRRAAAMGLVGGGLLSVKGAQEGFGLLEQHQTWEEAKRSNSEFFARHAADLERLTLGGSFSPEHFGGDRRGRREAIDSLSFAVREMGMEQLRLGLRWNQTEREDGSTNIDYYRQFIDYCLE